MKFTLESRWIESKQDNIIIALFVGFTLACIASAIFLVVAKSWFLILTLFIWVLVTTGLYRLLRLREPTIRCFFLADLPTATRVIKNVLIESGLVFTQNSTGFFLPQESVRIDVFWDRTQGIRLWGSIIQFNPYAPDKQLLINTLRTQIDEAFLPQGL